MFLEETWDRNYNHITVVENPITRVVQSKMLNVVTQLLDNVTYTVLRKVVQGIKANNCPAVCSCAYVFLVCYAVIIELEQKVSAAYWYGNCMYILELKWTANYKSLC